MATNMVTTVGPSGTLTLASKVNALSFVGSGTNSFYWASSSTTTAAAANASSNAWVGGIPFTVREGQGIQTLAFAMTDTTQSMTVYSSINIAGTAGQ